MGSPLDDLRKISNQVEKKKEENIKQAKDKQLLKKEMLSEDTLEQKRLREVNSQKAVKRAEVLKLSVVVFSFLFVASLLFFVFKFVIFGSNVSQEEVEFSSDGFITLDATTEEYSSLQSFIEDFVDKYKLAPKKTKIPFYSHLSTGKQFRFTKKLDEQLTKSGMEFKRVKENKDTGIFEVLYENVDGVSLTFNIVENKNEDLKIVKIF